MSRAVGKQARIDHGPKAATAELLSSRTRHVRMNASLIESETVVITFAPRATQPDAVWGKAPLHKLGHSVVSFIDVADTWFPLGDMRELFAAISPRLAAYRRIVTYGHSMGGYGALKYGRFFSARRSVGLGAALSVAPQDVGEFDQRRPRFYYRPGLHDGMAITAEDLADEAIAVFDPKHYEDSRHAAAIARIGSVQKVYNYFVGHDLMSPSIDAGNASAFLSEIVDGNGTNGLRRIIRENRNRSPRYVSRALDAMHAAGRFERIRKNLAVRHALPLADGSPIVRDVLTRCGYPVPDLKNANDWRTIFDKGSAEDAVKAAAGQPYSLFSAKSADARRFLRVHGDAEAFVALNAFCSFLCEQTHIGAAYFVGYADVVLKSGRTRAHYAAADVLLAQAEILNCTTERMELRRIAVDLAIRGEAAVSAHLFSSGAFAKVDEHDEIVVPAAAGEFMRSRAIDFGSGTMKFSVNLDGPPSALKALSCDVLNKGGRSLRPFWSIVLDGLGAIWGGFSAGRKASAVRPSVIVSIPRRKVHEPRLNIILKSDGSVRGDLLRFHGVTVVRI